MPIVDQYGRPISTQRLTQEIAGPSVAAVRPIVSTPQLRGITPQRMAAILREAETGWAATYVELAEEMEERDLHYLAVLGTRRRQVSQLMVTVEPADDSAEAEADAALVREWLNRQEIADEMFDLLDAIGKGYAVCEIIWETSERQWMPRRLEYRLPRWFVFDQETGSRLLLRDPMGQNGWTDLEPGKFVVHRHAAKSGVPIRGGLARCVAWAWMFKNYTTRDWVRFVEAYGQPLRVGKYDKGATEPEKDVLLQAVTNIAADAAAIIPREMDIEFVTAEGGGTSSHSQLYSGLLEYFDAQISKAVLGQTLTTQEGKGGTGSYALGKVHDGVRHDIERSDARQLAATLNRDIVRPMVLLNRGERRVFPKIRIGREEESDPSMLSEAVAKLAPYGLRVKAAEIRAKLGLSDPEDGDEVLGTRPTAHNENAIARALASSRARGDSIDRAVDTLLAADGWEPMMEPVIEPILAAAAEALQRGDTLEAFRERLPDLLGEMDEDAFVETLRRMGFSAALSGRAGLE